MSGKFWGGRFKEETNTLVDQFNASIGFDRRLYEQDIKGSMAHCKMLGEKGILSEEETSTILEALVEIKRELDHNELQVNEEYEDIHTLVEKTLIEKIGPLGEKLHTGRSRNDQVALDVRMYVRDCIQSVLQGIRNMQKSLVSLAEQNQDVLMPGYTHMQRAQPVLLAHHLLAYFEMLRRDRTRFQDTLGRTNVMPLGAAALSGSTFDLDREMVARELSFDAISRNSMDAVSDRDFVLDFLYSASVLMMHLSRLSEELILWSTQEFGFASISDAFCTGSSIMPQKKNPDIPELIRGKTGRVYGDLMALFTTMKGLPLCYNKDMQEDKEVLFDAADTVDACLNIMASLLKSVSFDRERMSSAIQTGFLEATDLADYLVRKGLPFRQAHEVVGKMVLFALQEKKELRDLTLAQMKTFSRQIDQDVYEWVDPSLCVKRRELPGGTGPGQVKERIKEARKELEK
ncbi:MAG: argininosuccinate lyase [Deltaproteobacteria bacterium]|nr:MAG: argininosuccinate lyase [Deltaproteobacteria bacterium]